MQDEYTRKAELDLVEKAVRELISYSSQTLDVPAMKEARAEIREKLEMLRSHRAALDSSVQGAV